MFAIFRPLFTPPRVVSQSYAQAKAANNTTSAAIALLELALSTSFRGDPLSRLDKSLLRLYIGVLRDKPVVDTFPSSPSSRSRQLARRGINRAMRTLGVQELFETTDSFGNYRNLDARLYHLYHQRVSDVLWTLGPFAFRALPDGLDYLKAKIFGARLGVIARRTSLWKGIENDAFLQRVLREHFGSKKVIRQRVASHMSGNIMRPALLSILLFYLGMHPTEEAFEVIDPPYLDYIYGSNIADFSDISFRGKKVALIVDYEILSTWDTAFGMLHRDINSFKNHMHVWAPGVSSIQAEFVSSTRQLAQAIESQRDADLIVIMAHGRPGEFVISEEYISEHLDVFKGRRRLKAGANLIFFSCSFGDTYLSENYEKNETWVKISRMLLNGGKAVAATSDLFTYFGPDDILEYEREVIRIMRAVKDTRYHATGSFLLRMMYVLYERFGRLPGIRVYDSTTDEVQFYPGKIEDSH